MKKCVKNVTLMKIPFKSVEIAKLYLWAPVFMVEEYKEYSHTEIRKLTF